jgi:hypothetical protein
LAHLSRELQLEQHLLLGKGEISDGGRRKTSILANVYEAVIGPSTSIQDLIKPLRFFRTISNPISNPRLLCPFSMIIRVSFRSGLNRITDFLRNIRSWRSQDLTITNVFKPRCSLGKR